MREQVANHILHVHVGRQAAWISLECLPGPGHVTVDAEAWNEADLPELEARGLVDTSRCWVRDWIENDGTDCLAGPDQWPGDAPWPVHCWFNGDCMVVDPIPLTDPVDQP